MINKYQRLLTLGKMQRIMKENMNLEKILEDIRDKTAIDVELNSRDVLILEVPEKDVELI